MFIRRSIPVLLCLAAIFACEDGAVVPADDACPGIAPPSQEDEILAGYAAAARAYEADNHLQAGWADWMILHRDIFKKAYVRARTDRRIRVRVGYLNPIVFDPPWTSETEHFAALERMMELAYPGWDFSFSADDPAAEFTVLLGDKNISYADGDTVRLVWEGILPHEFGHELGLTHHYCDETLQPCAATPPGEYEATCIMSRNSGTWGPAEQFVLNLGQQRYNQQVYDVMNDLNGRYPPDWPN